MARLLTDTGWVPMLSQIIESRRHFDGLLHGYKELWAVSYVVSPDLLLGFFQRYGFASVEIVVGENLSGVSLVEQYRDRLKEKGKQVTCRLAELVEQGKLRILIPSRGIHSKLCILNGPAGYRVIQGSANLTETARQATNQVNYVWYADVPDGDPWLMQVRRDYEAHRRDCRLFMGDLADLMRHSADRDTEALVEAWLSGSPAEAADSESRIVLQDLTTRSLQQMQADADPVFTISLPDAPHAKREVERLLAPAGAITRDHHATVDSHAFLRYVEKVLPVPLMRADPVSVTVQMALDGQVSVRSERATDPSSVDRALNHIEKYFATVDWGQSRDPRFAKESLFEALLCVLSSPFAHEHMKIRRRHYALIDRRGPRIPYIFGPSQNGKSTFVRFGLQLLAGKHLNPLPGASFTKTAVRSASALGTVFPLVFDDIDVVRKAGMFEEVLKSYWESWWQEDCAVPQLIFTSNTENLKDWAKSRVKRIDFDVHFASSEKHKAALNAILAEHNPMFGWFAALYLEKLRDGVSPTDDELHVGRTVLRDLYEYARRPLPAFFPQQPLEQTYDPGRKVWRDLLFGLHKAQSARRDDRLLITFNEDMQHPEVRAAVAHLPQTVKHQLKGRTVIIESPVEFEAWLSSGERNHKPWLARWWSSLWG